MRYRHTFRGQAKEGLGINVESDHPSCGLLVWTGRNGTYLDPRTFGELESGKDEKIVIAPKDLADMMFRFAELDSSPLPTRCAPLPGCSTQVEFHLLHSKEAVVIGVPKLEPSKLLVSSSVGIERKIERADLAAFLFDVVETADVR